MFGDFLRFTKSTATTAATATAIIITATMAIMLLAFELLSVLDVKGMTSVNGCLL